MKKGGERRPGGLVYSTDLGRTCPRCRRSTDECRCEARLAGKKPSGDGVVRVGRETKGRKGKGVIEIPFLNSEDFERVFLLLTGKEASEVVE